jgi:hypothetical protein
MKTSCQFAVPGLPPQRSATQLMLSANIEVERLKALRTAAKKAQRGRMLEGGALELHVRIFATPWDGDLGYFISGICHGLQAYPPLTLADLNVWAELPQAVDHSRKIGYSRETVISKIIVERLEPVNVERHYEIELVRD